ncbi:YIP1 family protein [Streptomyces sp. NPDC058374]|uniref:YIP1 family protein n=1 Tax=unclassified Streptomyces TaxID=2593676 RepID=UPI00365900CD
MAGFRTGRGRDNRTDRPHGQPRQQPYGQQAPYGGAPTPQGGYQGPAQQWPQAGGQGEPEYFGDPGHGGHQPYPPQQPHPQGGYGYPGGPAPDPYAGGHPGPDPYARRPQAPRDPYAAQNNAGHTQAFSIDEQYHHGGPPEGEVYASGPSGPRLHWKELMRGIVLRPGPTFHRMRDYQVWGPALTVTLLYGLLAIFGFDGARDDVINATLSTAIPYVLTTAVAFALSAFILGTVTHTLARQLGGSGSWQPTVGLSMLVMTVTDVPRLLPAVFMGGDASVVQIIGWLTWLAAGALFTSMVATSHDLPWPKALAASAIQLLALLSLIKLGTF